MKDRLTIKPLTNYFPDSKGEEKKLVVSVETEGRCELKILALEDVEKIVADLKKKRPKWLYKRELIIYEAWLKYYKAIEKKNLVKTCSNCRSKSLFIWWEPCSSCTPEKSNWNPKNEGDD